MTIRAYSFFTTHDDVSVMDIRGIVDDVRLVYIVLMFNVLLILFFEADVLGVAETFATFKVPLIIIACLFSLFNLLYLILRPV